MAHSSQLIEILRRQSKSIVMPDLDPMCNELLAQYGTAVQAILFYGSCFRNGDVGDGLVDLYLLVDSYRNAYRNPVHGALNKLLPPNVFYLETTAADKTLRAKYAIVSLEDFERGTSSAWFHSYLWARFAQPTGILFCRNPSVSDFLYTAFCQAVTTFITRTLPSLPTQFDARMLWDQGVLLTYRAELRSERPEKLGRLFQWRPQYYEQLTRIAMESQPFSVEEVPGTNNGPSRWNTHIPPRIRRINRWEWHLRIIQGKLLSALRLLKATLTFKGGIDYVLWKINRHSGISVEVPQRFRRIPLLGICYVFWRLYRSGGFR